MLRRDMTGAQRGRLARTAAVGGAIGMVLMAGSQGVVAQGETVTLGSYHSDQVPADALVAMVNYCQEQTGLTVTINTTSHNDFQNAISAYLQGTPDDLFTWFAGYRMQFFADQGLLTDISDIWAEFGSNYSDAFRAASTGLDGKQYFLATSNYPWPVLYRKSVFETNGYEIPVTWDDFVALAAEMEADGLIPMAFGDLDGWPAMGTFDILNMRINGYQFHVDLMAGREVWTDERVTKVFEAWKALIPYYSDGALGLDWQTAAQQLVSGQAGMYFLGTFAAQQAASQPDVLADMDFFPFPTLGTEFDGELGIDAPIDGFAIPALAQNVDGAKTLLKCFATGAAQDLYTAISTGDVSAANDASTDHYNAIQKKSAEIIAASGAIAQFLDRDTVPAFAGPNGMQALLQNFLNDPDQDLVAYQQTIADSWAILSQE